jgi:hypothetical protein
MWYNGIIEQKEKGDTEKMQAKIIIPFQLCGMNQTMISEANTKRDVESRLTSENFVFNWRNYSTIEVETDTPMGLKARMPREEALVEYHRQQHLLKDIFPDYLWKIIGN